MTRERRQEKRIPVEMWVEERLGSETYFQRSANLSLGGIYLDHTIPHPPGTVVQLKFTLPGDSEPISVMGEIVGKPDQRDRADGHPLAAGRGERELLVPTEDRIDVITSRGQWHYVFDTDGQLISKNTYHQSYDSFPQEGESLIVPTPPWLWTFSHPGISWAVSVAGFVMLAIMLRAKRGAKRLSG